jgi:hypothetical protein
MNLNDREIYYSERQRLFKLTTKALERLIGELYNEIYVQYNPERKEYHRIAVFVLNSRLKRAPLTFHLNSFIR